MAFSPGTSPSTSRRGLQAKWLRQPGSSLEQRLPAYPSLSSPMRNGGPLPAHLSSSSAFALGESRWLYPPQRAPDVLRPPISDFLTQCEQIEHTSREKMRNGGTPPAHLDMAERAKVFDAEGCKHNGFGDPALYTSNGSPPTPSPPSASSRPPSNVSTSFPTLVTIGGDRARRCLPATSCSHRVALLCLP